jgi:hypothetical protein
MPALRVGVLAVLVATTGCERADEAVSSEPLPEPIRVTAPRVDPPAPAVSMPAPPSLPRPINPRELPPPPIPKKPRVTWFSQLSSAERSDVREACSIWKADPCAGLLPRAQFADGRPARPDRINEIMGQFEGEDRGRVHSWCRANVSDGRCDTPLVMAFDAQPIALAPATAAAFAFRPGSPASTEWPTATTPWLALDRDGNGSIDSGAELFGDSTVLPDGTTAAHGFTALEALDTNRDGVIDRRDPMFAALLLWSDRDGDHASNPGELAPAAGTIESISLAFDAGEQGPRASITWRDASGSLRTGAVVDLYLRSR